MSNQTSTSNRSGSFLGMALSLAIVVVVVFVFFLLNNKPSSEEPRAVDYQQSLSNARSSGVINTLMFDPVPEGWVATSARYSPSPDDPSKATWMVGFVTDNREFVGIRQSNMDATTFIKEATVSGTKQGTQTINGDVWTRYVSEDTDNESLVRVSNGETTVVTGTVGFDELARLVTTLKVS